MTTIQKVKLDFEGGMISLKRSVDSVSIAIREVLSPRTTAYESLDPAEARAAIEAVNAWARGTVANHWTFTFGDSEGFGFFRGSREEPSEGFVLFYDGVADETIETTPDDRALIVAAFEAVFDSVEG